MIRHSVDIILALIIISTRCPREPSALVGYVSWRLSNTNALYLINYPYLRPLASLASDKHCIFLRHFLFSDYTYTVRFHYQIVQHYKDYEKTTNMFSFDISLTEIFIVVFLFLVLVYLLSRYKNLPPGPWGLPYLGYAPWLAYVMYYSDEPLHEHITRLGKRYGKVFSFTVFGTPFVVVNDHQVMKEALNDLRLNDRGENEMFMRTFSPTSK